MLVEVTMMIMIVRIIILDVMTMIMKTIWILITIIATTISIIILNHGLIRFLLNIYKHFLFTKRPAIVNVKNETISVVPKTRIINMIRLLIIIMDIVPRPKY